ncbi:hypothetical protein DdX_21676 [Ditylenchus destructor]|uniref:Uncharacterized protein n=1 Tax=Ditylenchus destructor TaxID=166010 RepID=A0AAD4MIN2_9BILA|nr:hypothetical protein DdX_21676 [Ditylenchus destructor]
MAVVASTLTTIAVFLPLVFVDGIAGQLFPDQALTVGHRHRDFAVGVDDPDSDAELVEGPAAAGLPEEAAAEPWQPQSRWQKPVALRPSWCGGDDALELLRTGVAGGAPLPRRGCGGRPGDAQGQRHRHEAVRRCRTWLPAAAAGGVGPSRQGAGLAALAFVGTMALVPMLGAT